MVHVSIRIREYEIWNDPPSFLNYLVKEKKSIEKKGRRGGVKGGGWNPLVCLPTSIDYFLPGKPTVAECM